MSYEGYQPDVAEVAGEPAERGWLARLISPHQRDGGAPTSFAFLLGGVGAVCFALSMVLDFVTIPLGNEGIGPDGVTREIAVTNGTTMGFVYAVGGLGLLTFMGSVINRPEVALRSRLGATALGIGLVGLVIGAAMRIPFDYTFSGVTSGPASYQPGVFCALGGAVLPTVAVWLAARPAARRAAEEEAEADRRRFERFVPPLPEPAPGQPAPRVLMRPAGAMDLTVTPE